MQRSVSIPLRLETRSGRIARTLGATISCGLLGYFIARFTDSETPLSVFLALNTVVPLVAAMFSLPRLEIRSCLGKGLLAALAFGLGAAFGED